MPTGGGGKAAVSAAIVTRSNAIPPSRLAGQSELRACQSPYEPDPVKFSLAQSNMGDIRRLPHLLGLLSFGPTSLGRSTN
jgi:hypothetical protein